LSCNSIRDDIYTLNLTSTTQTVLTVAVYAMSHFFRRFFFPYGSYISDLHTLRSSIDFRTECSNSFINVTNTTRYIDVVI